MVKIYFDGLWIDLTKWVDMGSISIRKTGDKTLDSASFNIPQIEHLSGLDVSRPFPRLARVTIQDDEFILQTDTISDLGGFFSHDIELVSVAKLMADTTNAGLTVTQPSGDIGLYYRSYSVYLTEVAMIDDNWVTVPFDTIEQSEDTTDIQDRTIKKNKKYTIYGETTFLNYTTSGRTFYVRLLVGGVVQRTDIVAVNRKKIFSGATQKKVAFVIDFENTGTKDVVVQVRREFVTGDDVFGLRYKNTKLSISTNEHPEVEKITLDYVVEKILHNDANEQRFYLSDNSKAMLKGKYSYEWTLNPSYLWLHITQVADYIKAFPTARYGTANKKEWQFLGIYQYPQPYGAKMNIVTDEYLGTEEDVMRFIEDYDTTYDDGFVIMIQEALNRLIYVKLVAIPLENKIIVDIVPFEELAQEYTPIGVTDKGIQATIDDYAASIEINADNVYGENNQIFEMTTLRSSNGITQIDYDDIVIPTTYPIGEIVSMRVRIPAEITVGSITKAQGDWIDIDVNRILPQEYYNTLDSMSSYTGAGRFEFSKNNCLYYKQGEKNIQGLAYLGLTTKSMISLTPYIRGIYELIIAQLTRNNGDSGVDYSGVFDNGTVTRDNQIAVEIKYRPYTETNAVVYKSDQTGFAFTTSKFLNESGTLNSPDIIGAYTQGIADRSGGTVHSFNGICRYDELPSILSTWGDLVLFAVSYSFIDWETVEYQLQYIKDYVFISSYESYNPKVRIYEIPKDTIIDRVIKKNNQVVFGIEPKQSDFDVDIFIQHLEASLQDNIPEMATLKHDNINTVLPCISQAIGRVVEFRVAMKDNYSAGLIKYTSGSYTYQKDYSYTNAFGRVTNTRVRFGVLGMYTDIISLNELPMNPYGEIEDAMGEIELTERKDARERSIYSYQVAYLSENNGIIIYDGIAKFSNVVNTTLRDIIWVEVSELPSRHAKVINQATIIREIYATNDQIERKLDITGIGANKVVCYDRNTLELIMGDNRKVINREIYYRGVKQ